MIGVEIGPLLRFRKPGVHRMLNRLGLTETRTIEFDQGLAAPLVA